MDEKLELQLNLPHIATSDSAADLETLPNITEPQEKNTDEEATFEVTISTDQTDIETNLPYLNEIRIQGLLTPETKLPDINEIRTQALPTPSQSTHDTYTSPRPTEHTTESVQSTQHIPTPPEPNTSPTQTIEKLEQPIEELVEDGEKSTLQKHMPIIPTEEPNKNYLKVVVKKLVLPLLTPLQPKEKQDYTNLQSPHVLPFLMPLQPKRKQEHCKQKVTPFISNLQQPGDITQEITVKSPQPVQTPPHNHEQRPHHYEQRPHHHEQKPQHQEQRPHQHEERPHQHERRPHYYEQRPHYYEQRPHQHEQRPHYYEQRPHQHEQRTKHHEQRPHHHEQRTKPHEQRPHHHEQRTKPHEQRPHHHEQRPHQHEQRTKHHEQRPHHHEQKPHHHEQTLHQHEQRTKHHEQRPHQHEQKPHHHEQTLHHHEQRTKHHEQKTAQPKHKFAQSTQNAQKYNKKTTNFEENGSDLSIRKPEFSCQRTEPMQRMRVKPEKKPEHLHQKPEHTHKRPEHTHKTPEHTHKRPEHAHKRSEHAHKTTEHTHKRSEHTHRKTEHTHKRLEHLHQRPEYAEKKPKQIQKRTGNPQNRQEHLLTKHQHSNKIYSPEHQDNRPRHLKRTPKSFKNTTDLTGEKGLEYLQEEKQPLKNKRPKYTEERHIHSGKRDRDRDRHHMYSVNIPHISEETVHITRDMKLLSLEHEEKYPPQLPRKTQMKLHKPKKNTSHTTPHTPNQPHSTPHTPKSPHSTPHTSKSPHSTPHTLKSPHSTPHTPNQPHSTPHKPISKQQQTKPSQLTGKQPPHTKEKIAPHPNTENTLNTNKIIHQIHHKNPMNPQHSPSQHIDNHPQPHPHTQDQVTRQPQNTSHKKRSTHPHNTRGKQHQRQLAECAVPKQTHKQKQTTDSQHTTHSPDNTSATIKKQTHKKKNKCKSARERIQLKSRARYDMEHNEGGNRETANRAATVDEAKTRRTSEMNDPQSKNTKYPVMQTTDIKNETAQENANTTQLMEDKKTDSTQTTKHNTISSPIKMRLTGGWTTTDSEGEMMPNGTKRQYKMSTRDIKEILLLVNTSSGSPNRKLRDNVTNENVKKITPLPTYKMPEITTHSTITKPNDTEQITHAKKKKKKHKKKIVHPHEESFALETKHINSTYESPAESRRTHPDGNISRPKEKPEQPNEMIEEYEEDKTITLKERVKQHKNKVNKHTERPTENNETKEKMTISRQKSSEVEIKEKETDPKEIINATKEKESEPKEKDECEREMDEASTSDWGSKTSVCSEEVTACTNNTKQGPGGCTLPPNRKKVILKEKEPSKIPLSPESNLLLGTSLECLEEGTHSPPSGTAEVDCTEGEVSQDTNSQAIDYVIEISWLKMYKYLDQKNKLNKIYKTLETVQQQLIKQADKLQQKVDTTMNSKDLKCQIKHYIKLMESEEVKLKTMLDKEEENNKRMKELSNQVKDFTKEKNKLVSERQLVQKELRQAEQVKFKLDARKCYQMFDATPRQEHKGKYLNRYSHNLSFKLYKADKAIEYNEKQLNIVKLNYDTATVKKKDFSTTLKKVYQKMTEIKKHLQRLQALHNHINTSMENTHKIIRLRTRADNLHIKVCSLKEVIKMLHKIPVERRYNTNTIVAALTNAERHMISWVVTNQSQQSETKAEQQDISGKHPLVASDLWKVSTFEPRRKPQKLSTESWTIEPRDAMPRYVVIKVNRENMWVVTDNKE